MGSKAPNQTKGDTLSYRKSTMWGNCEGEDKGCWGG